MLYYERPITDFLFLFFSPFSEVSWAYNWGSQAGGSLPEGVTYFAMLWGLDSGHTSTWMADATAANPAAAAQLIECAV